MEFGQIRSKVKSLNNLALNCVVTFLLEWERRPAVYNSDEWFKILSICWRYFDSYRPVMPRLVDHWCLQNSAKFSVLFLPWSIHSKKLKLHESITTEIVELLVDYSAFVSEDLREVSELCIEVNFTYRRDELFSKFPNLQTFRIERGLSDATLTSVARHFPHLITMDASRDRLNVITDSGLQELARLEKLRYVLLYTKIYYDDIYEDNILDTTPFSGRQLALLLSQQPRLVKFSCPDLVMNEVLDFMQFKGSRLSVESLDLTNIDLSSNVLLTISKVCPNLERLQIHVFETDKALATKQLKIFPKIKELHVEIFECEGLPFQFNDIGKHLLVLYLQDDNLKPEDLLAISGDCPNLRFVSMDGFCRPQHSLSLQHCLGQRWPLLFPRLGALELRLNLLSLHCFLHKQSNLVRVSIGGKAKDVSILKSLRSDYGFWPKVETISLTLRGEDGREVYDGGVVRHLVEVFPSLCRLFVFIPYHKEGTILTSALGNDVTLYSNKEFNVFRKYPEFDYLDWFQ